MMTPMYPPPSETHATPPVTVPTRGLQFTRVMTEGFIAGCIGASAVALWFAVVDVISGAPFFTPAMLGSALFLGVRDPALVQVSAEPVIMYTGVHFVAFLLAGTAAAILAAVADEFHTALFAVVVFFAAFEVSFYIIVAIAAEPLLGALAWWSVAVGNAIAAVGMGWYLWQAHPNIRAQLRAHPLGESMDGE